MKNHFHCAQNELYVATCTCISPTTPAMVSFQSFLGGLSWLCKGELDLGSPCIQRAIMDVANLLFVLVFYSFLLLSSLRKSNINGWLTGRDWINIAASVCCFIISTAYFSAGFWYLTSQKTEPSVHLVYFTRALIWISLTVSLLIQRSKSIKILVSIWWVLFFVFISAINMHVLVSKHGILLFDAVPWTVSWLLLFCSMRNIHFLFSLSMAKEDLSASEPLLRDESQGRFNQISMFNIFSKLFFSWVNPLLSVGFANPLVLEDIPSLVSEDQATVANEKFTIAMEMVKSSNNPQNLVTRAIVKAYLKEIILGGLCAFLRMLAVAIGPVLLYAIVNYSSRSAEKREGILLVGYLVIVKVIESLSHRHFFFNSRRTGMRIRSGLMVAVYQKQLKLSNAGRQRHSTGEVVNYIAVDAYRMGEFPAWLHVGWCSFVQLILAVGVLFGIVGLGVLPGLVPLLICGLINVPFAKIVQKCQSEFMIAQDKRLRSMSEILNNMKIIKLQSWEDKFKKLIECSRKTEFNWLSESQHKKIYASLLYWLFPTIVSSVILSGRALFGSAPLDAATIFAVLATLRTMSEPVKMLPEALSVLIQVKVSLDRINSFLVDDELNNKETSRNQGLKDDQSCIIKIQHGNFSWDQESAFPTLRDVNFEVSLGKKIAVCGPVGAGKSSLLYAVLGEITRTSGSVEVYGSVAYVSQSSWIQSGTFRDNILYGKAFDKTKYEMVIKVCALDKDIDSFKHGDLTEIGQRGLNMSGGQKQRIQLARSVYNDADVYLLDDPFSAVDAHSAATLFNDCVMAALEKKTVIFVTHQVEFLSQVDKILVMENGQVTQSGSYKDLLQAGTTFEQLVNAHKNAITELGPSVYETKQEIKTAKIDLREEIDSKENGEVLKGSEGVQLTEEEEKEIGNIGWKPFLDYVRISNGSLFLSLSIITQIGFVALQAAASYWLAIAIQIPEITNFLLIGVYTLISTTSAFVVNLRYLFATLLGLKASKAFFSGFTNSIFNAPMIFFDSTPVGRILTRASSDLSVLDFDIPFALAFVLSGIELLGSFIVMASVTWQVLIVAILATVATKYVQGYYQPSAIELTRINGTTKAPIMNYAAETSLGVTTIRAFKMEDKFFHSYLKLVDTDASTFFFSNAAMEWLVLRTEALQNLTVFTAALLLVFLPKDNTQPGFVGLSLSYALGLSSCQVFLTRWYCSLVNYLISVERIKQFMHIQPEPPAIIEKNRPPLSWPPAGRIQFNDLKIRYRPNSPLVLKGITCTFREGTTVGIVGRTGSGKTTLITALFRLVEPVSGRILIDGIDICSIGLKDLRMKLSIIPQEPTLFKDSVRANLDPLGLYSDEQIWKALEKCQLKSTISYLPNLLDSSVGDEGENWSVGQRQLFCLGRVLLKKNRILVLDEATASIDSSTDAILQTIIREEFSDCTVLTVAHRVSTVIDSDMVMVLSFGKLVEYDEPSKLMETNSSFSKLVAEYWSSCKLNSV